jgi:hypothetical protein
MGLDELTGLMVLQTGANPTKDDFKLRLSLEMPQQLYCSITDLQGRTLWQSGQDERMPGINEFRFPASDLSNGMYVYQVFGQTGSISGKFMVLH